MPVAPSRPHISAATQRRNSCSSGSRSERSVPPTILICDDEPSLRELMRVSLAPEYSSVEASNRAEAGRHPGPAGSVTQRVTRALASLSLLSRLVVGSLLVGVLVAVAFVALLSAMSHLRRSTNQQAQSKDVTAATLGLEKVVNQLE